MIKFCRQCGQPFEAKRSTALYCSSRCRLRAHRKSEPVVPDAPLPKPVPASFEDVADAVDDARSLSNRFFQLESTAPRQLRPGCGRIGDAIRRAVTEEEW